MVGLGSPDDAAVYRLDSQRALILTTDFFTPVVDDPYDYGAIAAANALSDVYAMGGKPILALNLVAFPMSLPAEVLTQVMLGMAETVYKAGAVIAGGHSIQDEEPKVGLCVVGIGHPDRLLTKQGACPGDRLVLTKPLGSGIITTAAKADQAEPADVQEAVAWMKWLNRVVGEVAVELELRGGTDITGFGLLGHAWELAEASNVILRFTLDTIPWMQGALRYADEGLFPGGSAANYLAYAQHVEFNASISDEERMLLCDAQTSGGLLLCIPEEKYLQFEASMAERHEPYWLVGEVVAGQAAIQVI